MARLQEVPKDVLDAVTSTPEIWPLILETVKWVRDQRTGAIRVEMSDGGRKGRLGREEWLPLGEPIQPPPGNRWVCPLDRAILQDLDHGNRWFCLPCDIIWTVWDLKRQGAHAVEVAT